MRTVVLAMIAGVGMLLVASLEASATPANGSAIAQIGKQVDPVINVATKKKKKGHAESRLRPWWARPVGHAIASWSPPPVRADFLS
jgi:hypothetical protein